VSLLAGYKRCAVLGGRTSSFRKCARGIWTKACTVVRHACGGQSWSTANKFMLISERVSAVETCRFPPDWTICRHQGDRAALSFLEREMFG